MTSPPPPDDYQAALAAAAALYGAAQAQSAARAATGTVADGLAALVGQVTDGMAAVRAAAAEQVRRILREDFARLDVWNGHEVQAFTERGARILGAAQTATARAAAAAQDAHLAAMNIRTVTVPTDPIDVRGPVLISRGAVEVAPRAVTVQYEQPPTVPGAEPADERPRVRIASSDMTTRAVLNRPARTVRAEMAAGVDEATAREDGARRLDDIVGTNLMLAQRLAEHEALAAAAERDPRIIGYRRVIHPERSKGGSCGLCVAASQKLYRIGTLKPIHAPECWCTVTAVTKDFDPGKHLNAVDLGALYGEAGGTSAAKLKRTRYQVDEHGELGAVLTPKKTGEDAEAKGASSKPDRPTASSGGGGGKPPADPPVTPSASGADDEPDKPKRGKVDRSLVRNVKQHELDTADRIAQLGHDVTFRSTADDSKDTADVLIGGAKWDFKSPTSGSKNTIDKRVTSKIDLQGGNVVLDLSRSPMTWEDGSALVQDLLRRYDDLQQVWLIKQEGGTGPIRSNIFGKEAPA
ncbi:CdiA C-terminal domain-containing protein [Tsukamurella ocularis]|uniref:CdiA C-terminal domain-containing protein n=1 Tax=Tsukamurella ocularis TaxID=1970234 RepID=UPI0039EEF1FC